MKKTILILTLLSVVFNVQSQNARVIGETTIGESYNPFLVAKIYTTSDYSDKYFFTYRNYKYTKITAYNTISMSTQALDLLKSTIEDLMNSPIGEETTLKIGKVKVTMVRRPFKYIKFYFYEYGVTSYTVLTKSSVNKVFNTNF